MENSKKKSIGIGLPVAEDATEPSPTTTTTTTTTTSYSSSETPQASPSSFPQLPEGHPMDDLLPGSSQAPLPAQLIFVDAPQHIETELAASVLLACRTAEPVAECQWSWQPLPPTHLPLPNIDETTATQSVPHSNDVSQNATTSSTSLSLPVRTFPAFGNASNDCSVRFSNVKHEQTGYWSCAARRADEETFTSTSPAKLSIVHVDTASLIRFAEQEGSLETPAGTAARLPCRTTSPVRECQWSWRQLNQSQPWDAEMRKFPASGNESTVCDLGLPAVRSEHEGFWTCGARVVSSSPFVQAPPIRLLISEVEFVQLSRGIQITAGETVFLRCLVNKPVFQCEWSWRPSNSSKNSTVVKKFGPNKETDHDCSVRFKNILYEEEGLWTCGVRLTPDGILHEAPSTTVTLLPSGKVNFTETPENTSAAVGSEATLRCATNGRIERCAWTWRALGSPSDAEPQTLHEFPSHGDLGRNCSLTLNNVGTDEQGYWTCHVYLAALNSEMTPPPPAKLTVYQEEDVTFSELSQDIQISSGGTVSLRCVTSGRVEQCRWSLTPEGSANTTVVVKQFAPAGAEARDCSVKLSHALQEQEGLWTCGARLHARQNYTDAPPARLSLIEPVVKEQPAECHLRSMKPSIESTLAADSPYTVVMNHTTGVCSLQFTPDDHDFGEWECEFLVNNSHVQAELGSASILLMNNSPDQQLGWLVGAVTSTVLFLLILVVVVVVCKTRLCTRKIPAFLETLPSSERKRNGSNSNGIIDSGAVAVTERYAHGPPKIDLSYANPNFLSAPESIRSVLPNRSPHLYERVGRRGVTPPAKSYENAKET
ncbi:hypothetical protein TSAR_000925 [Trichomalopsis sarcophagae]|uniref:Ig-like domain-containing protein n=1 Tax=Trichomalopsis sarcophagae TaxID=543379 RepID=A0A232F2C1_9HYME|nr:hypothetical protein TSAR_000925 [Trichomalopsis sarcophagae]